MVWFVIVTAEEKFPAHIRDFHDQYGRWPSAQGETVFERDLGVWLERQQIAEAHSTIDPFRRSYLNMVLPGWDVSTDEKWLTCAREAADFVIAYGRIPKPDAPRVSERLIGSWLSIQNSVCAAGRMEADRQLWLDLHCPGWLGTNSIPVRYWRARQS